ncbi:MAG: FkbM family methyltransferase [Desulfovibrionaceae bacterium]|nr:FkbM family methyltransferase [Desulfovibrionaceae bacterium]
MNLEKRLEAVPLRRRWDISPRQVCCIAMQADLPLLSSFMAAHPDCLVRLVLVPDLPDGGPEYLRVDAGGDTRLLPLIGLRTVERAARLSKVILCPPGPSGSLLTAMLCRWLGLGTPVYLYAGGERTFGTQRPAPNLYSRYGDGLRRVYRLLADQISRDVYAARVRALMKGEAGYLPLSPHDEYYHPMVQPERGDIMIDGGLSGMLEAQKRFAHSVGEDGRVFGFEPVASMAAAAREKLAAFRQYYVHSAGLIDRVGQARFRSGRGPSRMDGGAGGTESLMCDMTTVDTFVHAHCLGRVNCIKLNVEGAEMAALRGSAKTIAKHRPKLFICLYHKPSDMIDVPLFLAELVPDYKLYVAHSSCGFTDTILYARC